MKKDKKNFIKDLLEDESTAKNANIKAYMFMKKSKSISVSDTTLDRMHNCGKVVKYALDTVNEKKKLLYTEMREFMPRTSENNGKLLKYLKEKYAELDKPVLEERLEKEKKKTLGHQKYKSLF